MKNILVTGSKGYIGSHAVKQLKRKKYNVIEFDKQDSLFNNLLIPTTIEKVFNTHNIDCVIHFAGVIEAGESMIDPQKYYFNNVVGTLNLLNIMLRYNCKKIIFSSTAAVYDTKMDNIKETDTLNPHNVYGKTKLIVENILEDYHKAYNLNYVALRYFNASGADESGKLGENHNPETHLIPIVLKVAKKEKDEINVYGDMYKTRDGTCVRDYIHVNDLVEAHILALEKIDKLKNEIINLGNGKGYSVFDIIKMCEKVTNTKINIRVVGNRPGDADRLVADYTKAKKILKWKPKRHLKQIIKTAWNYERRKRK